MVGPKIPAKLTRRTNWSFDFSICGLSEGDFLKSRRQRMPFFREMPELLASFANWYRYLVSERFGTVRIAEGEMCVRADGPTYNAVVSVVGGDDIHP